MGKSEHSSLEECRHTFEMIPSFYDKLTCRLKKIASEHQQKPSSLITIVNENLIETRTIQDEYYRFAEIRHLSEEIDIKKKSNKRMMLSLIVDEVRRMFDIPYLALECFSEGIFFTCSPAPKFKAAQSIDEYLKEYDALRK